MKGAERLVTRCLSKLRPAYIAAMLDASEASDAAANGAALLYAGTMPSDPSRTIRESSPLPPSVAQMAANDPMRVWFRFIRLNRRVTAAMAAELRALGLSIPQFDVLSTLTEQEGLTQQDLAGRLYVTKGNVSGLIDRLVEAGLVERRAIPGDRRSHALHLTAAGSDVAARGLAIQTGYVGRTLGGLEAGDLAELERLVLLWRDRARNDTPAG